MDKLFTRVLLLLTIIIGSANTALAQTITLRPVDPGPYGQGSSIGVSFKIDYTGGYFTRTGNTFRLQLSDANGNFGSAVEIGSYTGFYNTYINGVIPSGTPAGSSYRIRIIANSPAVTSTLSNTFSIVGSQGNTPGINSSAYLQNTPDVWGLCEGINNRTFTFTNSNSSATVTAKMYNEGNNTALPDLNFSPGASFTASTTNYTIIARAEVGGVIGTKAYPLINNRVFTNLGTSGSNIVCKNDNTELPFFIDYESSAGIQNNFPGLTYRISYGDGTAVQTFTIFDIRNQEGRLTHMYTQSSCGFDAGGDKKGVFRVELQSVNPYCGNVGTTSPQFAQVLEPAVNKFNVAATGCVGKAVEFTNISNPGQSPTSSTGSCENPNALYTWKFGDGTQVTNKRYSDRITHVYTTPGQYTVTLVFQPSANDKCDVADYTMNICIVNPPVPKFTITATGCTDNNISVTNTSTYDNTTTCTTITPTYRWTVTPATGFTYTAGTSATSASPVFRFTQAGKYSVRLTITGGCDAIQSAPQEIMVDATPTVTLSPAVTFCQVKLDIPFNETADKTKTVITGTAENESPNYEWTFPTVPAGATQPVFISGSTKNSRYPTIRFDGAGTYVVKVRHQNNCGVMVERTQQITLRNAPQLDPKFTALICPDDVSNLDANLTAGTYNTLTWQSTDANGVFGNRNSPTTTYKPSAAEIAAGKATLTLTITTDISGCESITSSPLVVSIKPVNDITSATSKNICTNTALNYTITSPVAGSTYEWKVVSNSPSVSGYTASGTTKTINDVLINSSTDIGSVVYEITPINGNCTGNVHRLTVRVDPAPRPQFEIVGNNYGCGSTTITFRNTSASTTGRFLWDFGDGNGQVEINDAEFTRTFEPFTNGDGSDRIYQVTLTQQNSCSPATTPAQSIRIKPLNPVPLIANAPVKTNDNGSTVDCGSFTLTVKNNSKGTDETYVFRLEDEDGNLVATSIATPNQITKNDKSDAVFRVVPVETTTYYLNMTATNRCGNSASIPFRWPVNVSVSGVSVMTIRGGQKQACVNEEVVFENGSIGTTYRYTIYKDDNTTPYREFGAPLGASPFRFTEPGKYNVTVTATNGDCGDAAPSSYSANQITILATPTVTFTTTSENCSNAIKFTPVEAVNTSYVYAWEFGDGATSNDPNPSHIYATSGTYNVKLSVTNTLGCGDAITQPVVVKPALKADFAVSPGQEITIPDYHFSFKDNSDGNPSEWYWEFGNGATSTQRNPEYTYPQTDIGSHEVKLTITRRNPDGTPCTDFIVKTVTISGTPGSLYLPNAFIPTNSSSVLQTFMAKGTGIKAWRMQIFNKWGQLVWETDKLGANGEPVEGWDGTFKGTAAPQGAYIWQVSATFINGTEWKGMSYGNSPPKRNGVINLIR
ncbi:PKD domain-containing protein [Mucilaginibacter sp. UR6-1]|uniref:PKD domain-containing protein n=1 Tax=Mucilaginibacter sp. UR6-1 TaxID=1435643 RepID=UPI001E29F321|nr:PKD domain-containing protein [Mucilaginibacter sp. UR6-1]MCC8407932.1 PKD domain-containing protein [Mucilaginibacter sp. UR6-1]